MKRFVVAGLGFLALAAMPASAADLPRGAPYRGPAYVAQYNWTAKLEYLHVDLGHINCDAVSCATPTRVGFHADEVRAGLNFRF